MSGQPVLETRDVALAYATHRGTISAVAEVSMQVAPGECVAICGRSGSGKSTLLALLGGLCAPTSGTVLFSGRPWTSLGAVEIQAARAEQIGFLLQESVLLPGLRAIDNVMLPQLIAGRDHESAFAEAQEMLARVGLAERWDAYPAELSGGQQRRVALARTLATEPRVILADEPTNDLDAYAEQEIIRILAEIKAAGTTAIVVVTHDPAVATIADRRLWMEQGALVDAPELPAFDRQPIGLPTRAGSAATAFEPAPADLVPQVATPVTMDWWRMLVPFAVGLSVAAAALGGIDWFVARRQRQAVNTIRQQRRLAEEMALQDLRADIDDVVANVDGSFTAALFLDNVRSDRNLYVLGPATAMAVQRDGRWESLPTTSSPETMKKIREVGAERVFIPVTFSVPEGRYDELLRGYLHVRISATMVVSDRNDGTGDLFERADAYYVYLRDPQLTEDKIRAANGWAPKATVPRWIAMPAH